MSKHMLNDYGNQFMDNYSLFKNNDITIKRGRRPHPTSGINMDLSAILLMPME